MAKLIEAISLEGALHLIEHGQLAQLRGLQITPHFTWKEAFVHRSDERIQDAITRKPKHLQNIFQMACHMEFVRAFLGHKPVTVTSWYRDPVSNRKVGGASRSYHLFGRAVDFTVSGLSPGEVQRRLNPVWFGGLGYGHTFTHLDQRAMQARWSY